MYHGQYEVIVGKKTVPSGECYTHVTFINVSRSVLSKLLYTAILVYHSQYEVIVGKRRVLHTGNLY